MSDMLHTALVIAVIALVTALLRFLPFLVFNGRRPIPGVVRDLGKILPYAVMAMLVVYCLRGISFSAAPHGIPELIAAAVVIALQVWRRNTLLSIIGGTACYMLLVQLVF